MARGQDYPATLAVRAVGGRSCPLGRVRTGEGLSGRLRAACGLALSILNKPLIDLLSVIHHFIEGIKSSGLDNRVQSNRSDIKITLSKILRRSEEHRVGKECRCRWSPYH